MGSLHLSMLADHSEVPPGFYTFFVPDMLEKSLLFLAVSSKFSPIFSHCCSHFGSGKVHL